MTQFIKRYGINFVYLLVFSIILLFFVWATYDYQKSLKNNLLSESRIIAYQMKAMKNYLQRKQDQINTDSMGEYEFKGVHPDAAVREISQILQSTPYFTIRQVSLAPRNEKNLPDKFETAKLKEFDENPGLLELYGEGSVEGHKVFRYIIPLRIDATCLPCHGARKGEIDITGRKKEGYRIGDLIGGISVIIQSYSKYRLLRRNMSVLLIFIFLLTFAIGIIIHSLKTSFDEKVAEVQRMEKAVVSSSISETFNQQLNDRLHKLVMYNLRNPVGDVIDDLEMLKDVPMNVLRSSWLAANKISEYSSKIIELRKVEQGKIEILLEDFDFVPVLRARLKAYENTARKHGVRFACRTVGSIPKIVSDKNVLFRAIDKAFLFVLRFANDSNGEVKVITNLAPDGGSVSIIITNNTRRIGVAYESLIFEKFADIKDVNENFMFNTEVDLVMARILLKHLNCELILDADNKELNVFNITIPVRAAT